MYRRSLKVSSRNASRFQIELASSFCGGFACTPGAGERGALSRNEKPRVKLEDRIHERKERSENNSSITSSMGRALHVVPVLECLDWIEDRILVIAITIQARVTERAMSLDKKESKASPRIGLQRRSLKIAFTDERNQPGQQDKNKGACPALECPKWSSRACMDYY